MVIYFTTFPLFHLKVHNESNWVELVHPNPDKKSANSLKIIEECFRYFKLPHDLERSVNNMVRYIKNASMLTSKQAARFLGVHLNTVRRWSDRGLIKAYRIGPRRDRRFRHEDLMSFLTQQTEDCKSLATMGHN